MASTIPGAAKAFTVDNTRTVTPGQPIPINIDNLAAFVAGTPPAAHAASHSNGGTDEISVEALGTADATAGNLLQSDGDGSLSFATPVVAYDGTYTNSILSQNGVATGNYGVGIGYGTSVAANATAIGNGAQATAANATAIGNGVVNATTNTVRLGWANTAGDYINFNDFSTTAETPTATHTIPITVNGGTWRILLTNA